MRPGGLLGRSAAGALALLACLCACAAPASSTLTGPPIGPWKGSRGVRQQPQGLLGGEKPLVERCQERWVGLRMLEMTVVVCTTDRCQLQSPPTCRRRPSCRLGNCGLTGPALIVSCFPCCLDRWRETRLDHFT